MKKHYNIQIFGKVQGVFFRKNAQEKAEEFNIAGFVRNDSDGSVYIEAEGEKKDLQQFLQWCHHGSVGSSVEEVAFEEGFLVYPEKFEIRHEDDYEENEK